MDKDGLRFVRLNGRLSKFSLQWGGFCRHGNMKRANSGKMRGFKRNLKTRAHLLLDMLLKSAIFRFGVKWQQRSVVTARVCTSAKCHKIDYFLVVMKTCLPQLICILLRGTLMNHKRIQWQHFSLALSSCHFVPIKSQLAAQARLNSASPKCNTLIRFSALESYLAHIP